LNQPAASPFGQPGLEKQRQAEQQDFSKATHQERQPLFLVRKSVAVGMVADKAVPHAEGILAESGVGLFHLALEKIRTNHAGTTDSLATPYVKYIH
jgi:hypothetical protein